MKKKKDGDDEDDRKKDGGKNVGAESAGISSTIYTPDDEEDEETKIHPDTAFETLKDGSTALIIKPGFRLGVFTMLSTICQFTKIVSVMI